MTHDNSRDRADKHVHNHTHGHSHDHTHSHAGHEGHHGGLSTEKRVQMAKLTFPRVVEPLNRDGIDGDLVLFIDAIGGISGDMLLSGLLDLGLSFTLVQQGVQQVGLEGVELVHGQREHNCIVASGFDVIVRGKQPLRTWVQIDEMLVKSSLTEGAKVLSRRVFERLAKVEGQMHGVAPEQVHFHEVGAVDSIVDIVGVSVLLDALGAKRIVCSALPIGHGTVDCAHGTLPLPAPATGALLEGVPTYGVAIEGETVTPTGAAIAVSVADEFGGWPQMKVQRVGFGSGSRVWRERPNLLRCVLGAAAGLPPCSEMNTNALGVNDGGDGFKSGYVVVETNIDDMTGEHVGSAIRGLLRSGALDAWASATTMKKGRPGLVLSVLGYASQKAELAGLLLRYTTSFGVRMYEVKRVELERKTVRVTTKYGDIAVKVATADGTRRMKPEFDECEGMARVHGVGVQDVILAAQRAALEEIGETSQ